MRPSRSTVIWSATAKTSCRLWEIRMTASPCSRKPLDEREHLLGLRDAERGGRLVEDHELRVPHHRTRDRDRLALAARERRNRLADRADRRHAQRLQRLGRLLLHHRLLEPLEEIVRLAPEVHVLDDVEVVAEREILVDDLDPELCRVLRPGDRDAACPRRGSRRSPTAWMPAIDLISVDLPAPLSPTSAITSPGAPRDRRRVSAWTEPNDFVMPRSSRSGIRQPRWIGS